MSFRKDNLNSFSFIVSQKRKFFIYTNYSRQRSIAIKPRFKSSVKFKKIDCRFSDKKHPVDFAVVKELDEETNLYYYGARYLDPRTSRWIAGDPAIWQGDYIPSPGQSPDRLGGMGGLYNTLNFHVYGYAFNNPIRYVDLNGREAWEHTSTWTPEAIAGYNQFVNERLSEYERNGRNFTCEDLALSLLIDYASQNGLPVSITNNSGLFRSERTYSSNSNEFNSIEGFKTAVLSTTGARDLMKSSNTVPMQLQYLTRGDLLLLDTGLPNGQHDGIKEHVQVVTNSNSQSVDIAQGSLGRRGSSNPNARNYIGVPITRGSYNLSTNNYQRGNTIVRNGFETFGVSFRRWNFYRWN